MCLWFKRKLSFVDVVKKTSLVIFMATIMIVGVLGTNYISDANALKSKNGASSGTDICGLMPCSDYPGGKAAYQDIWSAAFRNSVNISVSDHSEEYTSKIVPSSHNVDQEFPAQLDDVIRKFELDKISADEALEGIMEVHMAYVNARITSDVIDRVGDKLKFYNKGIFDAATAIEAIHLTAEPQNVDPEYQGALDEVIHKFELDKISADEALEGITEVHYGFVDLYITSNLVESIGIQLNIYESGNDSASHVLEEIHEVIEEEEATMAALLFVDGEVMVKELPPNTVDMPTGAGVPGCETNDMCYTPSHLTVNPGTTVTWINSDGSIPHTVTAGWADSESIGLDYPGGNGFDSDFMSGGAEFKHTFETSVEYDYYCQLHPWMIDSVTVA